MYTYSDTRVHCKRKCDFILIKLSKKKLLAMIQYTVYIHIYIYFRRGTKERAQRACKKLKETEVRPERKDARENRALLDAQFCARRVISIQYLYHPRPFLSYHNRVHTICGAWNGNEQEMDDFSYRKVGRVEKASLPFLSLSWSDRDCYRLPTMLRFFNASGNNMNISFFLSSSSVNICIHTHIYIYEYTCMNIY